MGYALGVTAFALAVLASICLHEAGHAATAKAFGMKVTRFFVGYGPTLWSWRRGETEYGLKAIPLGGFVKITGMVRDVDEIAPGDERRAMWRYPAWKRSLVMAAGPATHLALGCVLMWVLLALVGVPNPALSDPGALPAYVEVQDCVPGQAAPGGGGATSGGGAGQRACRPGDPVSPARAAGLRTGDRITSVNGVPVGSYRDLVDAVRAAEAGSATIGYLRAGQAGRSVPATSGTVTADLVVASRTPTGGGAARPVVVLGVVGTPPPGTPTTVTYGPVESAGRAVVTTGQSIGAAIGAVGEYPQRLPAVWRALTGAPRDADTPISVVGASRLGGESVRLGSLATFLSLLISINLFLGVFNLLPLLPLDGGHIAVYWFERVRSLVCRLLRRPDPGGVDYLRLAPVTWAVILLGGGVTLLTVAADLVNPATLQ